MIKVVPYIQTIGTEKYQSILGQPFDIEMLCLLSDNTDKKTLFEGWRGKNMVNWHKFTNDNGHVIEFYPDHYIVKKAVGSIKFIVYQLPLPKTIDDFINDLDRFEIELHWGEWIDEIAEPKDYMNKNEIEGYFTDLLNRIGKGNEIN